MGRFVPITFIQSVAEKASPAVPGAKAYYDGKQCWQYKIVYDRPGTYTYTLPSNAICARTVLVGGGGKPKCIQVPGDPSGCNSAAGAGGAYSEKIHAVTGGSTTFSIVVGRQEQDTTMACNSVAVYTAGGASGCVPGVATGGDWNSRGGCVGFTCNNCGGSYSHHCGSCKYLCLKACCGYCIVFQYDPASGTQSCCSPQYAGGASAGSPLALCGGAAWGICGSGGGMGPGGTASGGGGIGTFMEDNCRWHYNCCDCICIFFCDCRPPQICWKTTYVTSAQGGGGTKPASQTQCRSWASQNCMYGSWQGGNGGPGGADSTEGEAWVIEWGWEGLCSYPYGSVFCNGRCSFKCVHCGPVRTDWWDIHDIKGSGSPGTVGYRNFYNCTGTFMGVRPRNSGEGAGTGAFMILCCNPMMMGQMIGDTDPVQCAGPLVNWTKICSLGTTGQCDQAWHMQDALFPFFMTCAGTLGGSGGMSLCGYSSKAGKGGGGGQGKCQLLCVCWGGAFDCCNQTASTPLAFPPCLLDQLVSNAGTGMAIIYYREA